MLLLTKFSKTKFKYFLFFDNSTNNLYNNSINWRINLLLVNNISLFSKIYSIKA